MGEKFVLFFIFFGAFGGFAFFFEALKRNYSENRRIDATFFNDWGIGHRFSRSWTLSLVGFLLDKKGSLC